MREGFEQESTKITEVFSFTVSSVISVLRMDQVMHPLFLQAAVITHDKTSAAIEFHKHNEPGLLSFRSQPGVKSRSRRRQRKATTLLPLFPPVPTNPQP